MLCCFMRGWYVTFRRKTTTSYGPDAVQVESFLLARDLFLKPGGQLLPSAGTIFFCPFTDSGLHAETEAKVSKFQ